MFYISKRMNEKFYKNVINKICKQKIKCKVENIETKIIYARNVKVAYNIDECKHFDVENFVVEK